MNTFAVEIWNDELGRCTFYSVRWIDAQDNETDEFFNTYDALPKFEEATAELLSLIEDVIGDTYGAIDDFFNRPENEVYGLPPQGVVKLREVMIGYPNFPLRLYALKITNEIVVLFNGGIKDGATNQTSSLLSKWREACAFAKVILNHINEDYIIVDEDIWELRLYNGTKEILLEI